MMATVPAIFSHTHAQQTTEQTGRCVFLLSLGVCVGVVGSVAQHGRIHRSSCALASGSITLNVVAAAALGRRRRID